MILNLHKLNLVDEDNVKYMQHRKIYIVSDNKADKSH